MDNKTFNVTYSCGCVHEIIEDMTGGVSVFNPTGNNKPCGKRH